MLFRSIASLVVARFQGSIEKVAVLAVYMPIVAGQGGNAATQALAVVVRSMAQGEIGWPEARQVILREALAGMLNGMVTGSIAAFAAALLHGNPLLGFVLGTAMVINLFIAGLFGALVPVVLRRSGIDPAVASSIFVTTATDFFGFLTFLGLGSLLLAG